MNSGERRGHGYRLHQLGGWLISASLASHFPVSFAELPNRASAIASAGFSAVLSVVPWYLSTISINQSIRINQPTNQLLYTYWYLAGTNNHIQCREIFILLEILLLLGSLNLEVLLSSFLGKGPRGSLLNRWGGWGISCFMQRTPMARAPGSWALPCKASRVC